MIVSTNYHFDHLSLRGALSSIAWIMHKEISEK